MSHFYLLTDVFVQQSQGQSVRWWARVGRSLLLGLLLLLTGLTAQAQKTWTGATTTDWTTASNWNPAGIPTASDDVVIPSSPAKQPILSSPAVARTVEVQSGASLSIKAGGTLTINGSRSYSNGIYGPTTTAFYNYFGTVINEGQVVIGNTAAVGNEGLWNKGNFTNNPGGVITIDRSSRDGLYNSGGTFTNAAKIVIGANASVGNTGLTNEANFINNSGGIITIDQASSGLYNRSGSFTNAATITIGGATTSGIYNQVTFFNNPGGVITIGRASYGLYNNGGRFTNAAQLIIGAVGVNGAYGVLNNLNGTVTNTGCGALLTIVADAIISNQDGGTLTNSGTIIENASGNSNIATNSGLVQNLNGGTFSIANNTGTLTTTSSVFWTGCISTDWNTLTNWSQQRVPLASDDVVIPSSPAKQPILSNSAVARTVEVQSGASLSITSSGRLTVNGSKSISTELTIAFYNTGKVTNEGQIVIGNTASVGKYGLYSQSREATFTNKPGGIITIDRSSSIGLNNSESTFTNEGQIIIGAIASVGETGVRNAGTFTNSGCGALLNVVANAIISNAYIFTNSGTIIENASGISNIATNSGLVQNLNGGSFTFTTSNSGTLTTIPGILWTGCTSTDWNTATNWSQQRVPLASDDAVILAGPAKQPVLSSSAVARTVEVQSGASLSIVSGGRLTVNGDKVSGIYFSAFYNTGTVTNSGQLTIGNTAGSGIGLQNGPGSRFTNQPGGVIAIDRTSLAGLYNNGNFTNEAQITIGPISLQADNVGVLNRASFNNLGCGALLNVVANAVISNNSTFTNSGTILENSISNSNISTNSGLVRNLNGGTFSITTNTGVLTTQPGGAGVSISASPSLTVTQGQSVTLTASGATSYKWSTGETSPAISASVTGTYLVTGILGSCSSSTSVSVNVKPVPDLTPLLYVRPLTVYGTSDLTVVVDVVEINSIATSGLITVKLTKDAKFPLSFDGGLRALAGHKVQNANWTFSSESGFYVLTSTQPITGGDKLSVGLSGQLSPGATSGVLTVSAIVVGGSGGERRADNNMAANKIDYFQQ